MTPTMRVLFDDHPLPDIWIKGKIAEKRAKALLLAYLTPKQRKTYRFHGVIDVPGRGGTVLRIEETSYGGVTVARIDRRGRILCRYCVRAQPRTPCGYALPLADRQLTLLVWLTADRRAFYQRARRFGKRLEFSGRRAENLGTTE